MKEKLIHQTAISFGEYLLSQRRFSRVTGQRTQHAESGTDLPASVLLKQVSHADVENWRLEKKVG